MKVYQLLDEKGQRTFDAIVASLLLRGKKLNFAIAIAAQSAIRKMEF